MVCILTAVKISIQYIFQKSAKFFGSLVFTIGVSTIALFI